MKQTAVEYLLEKYKSQNTLLFSDDFEQAKEIENEKQGYSEEELKSAFKIGFSIGYGSTVQELDLKNEHCEKWFNKFKKK